MTLNKSRGPIETVALVREESVETHTLKRLKFVNQGLALTQHVPLSRSRDRTYPHGVPAFF